jgi:hypothetical protein
VQGKFYYIFVFNSVFFFSGVNNWLDNGAKAHHPSPDKVSIDDFVKYCFVSSEAKACEYTCTLKVTLAALFGTDIDFIEEKFEWKVLLRRVLKIVSCGDFVSQAQFVQKR